MILSFQNSGKKYAWTWQSLYDEAGLSRQAVYNYRKRLSVELVKVESMVRIVKQERKYHKRMGLKKIYYKNASKIECGRDIFMNIMLQMGYGIRQKRAYHITTKSLKGRYFPNLIKGLKIRSANRVWQSDITYFKYDNNHYYLTLIVDVYTRYIVGYHFDDNMLANTMIEALKMAIKNEEITTSNKLIHHSDRGTQYGSKQYIELLNTYNIDISMCVSAYENAYAERLNRTIKEEYLDHKKLDVTKPLTTQIKKEIKLYNEQRPHWHLPNYMTPKAFKDYIKNIPLENRLEMTLYTKESNPQDQNYHSDPVLKQTGESALPNEEYAVNQVYN